MMRLFLLLLTSLLSFHCDAWIISLQKSNTPRVAPLSATMAPTSTTDPSSSLKHLEDPTTRDSYYQMENDSSRINVAQYLLDLHAAKATFDFCGGMLFQLVLSDALKSHLEQVVATDESKQPIIFDAKYNRMMKIPNYQQTGNADNINIFHGRELRQIPTATGGMGMVLQLSLADSDKRDPEGWSIAEEQEYDGWGHDSGRKWRKANDYMNEGWKTFDTQFPNASSQGFGLHHRFYLHMDNQNRMWLSAEDGCEGTPSLNGGTNKNTFSKLFGL